MKITLGMKLEEKLTAGFPSYNKAIIAVATELEKHTENVETLDVACHLVCTDAYMIGASNNATELARNVLEYADEVGEYCSMEYNPCEFLNEDDADYECPDSGLPLVDFNAIWETFKTIADVK